MLISTQVRTLDVYRYSMRRVLLATVLFAGCAADEPASPKTVVALGKIVSSNGQTFITFPSSAAVGDEIVVSVKTVGDDCFSAESTDVAQAEMGGDLTPYDRQIIPGPHSACPLIEIYLAHSGTFRFATPGMKVITIHGIDVTPTVTIDVQ